MNKFIVSLVMGLSLVSVVHDSPAASYPEKQIRLVVPFPAGGPSDFAARTVADGLTRRLGQPVIVENQGGAGGAIAAQTVMRSAPDGYTLLWSTASMGAIPLLQRSPPFKSLNDFTPVGLVGRFAFGLFVHPATPAASVAELTAHARSQPGKLTYATGALSEYLVATDYMNRTGAEMMRVPYKGAAQAMPDLLAGRVQVFFTPLGAGLPYARTGQLRLLATLQGQRSPLAPDVPTLEEAGVRGIVLPTWQAVMAPPGTPASVVEALAARLQEVLHDDATRSRLEERALSVEAGDGKRLSQEIAKEMPMWERFVRDNDIPRE
ncbi:tripartite tricarboxylate transporter substrate binding protein [Noviherbaspirillum galbum]|uniref:Tripartite tricarboxylate transporter substrate binding protein n=1 Tax=Noviherbaspirillum galbum TaxID=2709383 RepID=A0A6B3SWN1_9BURK|nr:tripartite tricarboxylate transporter substrate binding protein [Noviherbaspirillum galbum]NEX62129.1 tripartite tricarboxylate transporter substrate binding protein [Noviherbaspirillum galbum]